MAVQLCVYN